MPDTVIADGFTEGERCNRDGCEGVLLFKTPEHCTCHISPPCHYCVENPLQCPVCGWSEADER